MRTILRSLCTVTMITLSVSAGAQDKEKRLDASEIIASHLEACGGRAALSKFKSRVAVGTVQKESAAAVPFAIMSEAPNRVSAIYQFQDTTPWQLTYDAGKTVFRPQFPRAYARIEEKYREMLGTGTLFNGISLYNILLQGEGSGVKFEGKGTKKVKDRLAYVVEAKLGKSLNVRLYFDTKTFMWVRTDYGRTTVTHPMSTFTNDATSKDEETTYDFYVETSDFKQVDGVKLPFRVEMVTTRPILREKDSGIVVGLISEYHHNIPIDPKMFH